MLDPSRRRVAFLAAASATALVFACVASRRATPYDRADVPVLPAPSPASAPRALEPQPTVAAIADGDLMTRVYVYAADSMEGRAAGTRGAERATAYIERELRRLALEPAGDGGSFFQAVTSIDAPGRPPARNVVAVLRGRDPLLRGEYVALGAHSDHVGIRAGGGLDHDSVRAWGAAEYAYQPEDQSEPLLTRSARARVRAAVAQQVRGRRSRMDSIHNGADDDGSGSMALLEIAEALVSSAERPRRSVLFVWHTGEELGLVGSDWFTRHPTVPRASIVAQINIDMIGRGGARDTRGGGPDFLAVVGARRLSAELGEHVEAANRASPTPLRLDYTLDAPGHPTQMYCRSDHYNYARFGIPVVFLFTGVHGDYHQVTDEAQYLDYAHYGRITRFAHDLVRRVGDSDRRPLVNGRAPDPEANCRQ